MFAADWDAVQRLPVAQRIEVTERSGGGRLRVTLVSASPDTVVVREAATLPNGLSGLTSNHNWATVRKLGSVNLLIHATNNLKFSFEYYRNI